MKIEYKSTAINNIDEWENLIFSDKKKKHWKVGRSAYSIADFILHKDGASFIENRVSGILNEDITIDKINPEFEVRFDRFGHGREHDLGIKATTSSGKQVFIGVEAKVDEPFGYTIETTYLNAKTNELNGVSTNIPKRIEELLNRNFKSIKKSLFNLRYQLLYSTVGTTKEEADIHVLLVLVFKTSLSDLSKIAENKKDYLRFFKEAEGGKLEKEGDFKIKIDDKELFVLYNEIAYQEIK